MDPWGADAMAVMRRFCEHAITGVTPRARGGDRGSGLAVTAPELNAGAGVGKLGGYAYGRREVEEQLVTRRLTQ